MARITTADEAMSPALMTWRSVFAGAVIGLAFMVLIGSLWFAFAFGSDYDAIRTNFNWYVGGTGIFSLLIGFGTAVLGGLFGGTLTRPASLVTTETVRMQRAA